MEERLVGQETTICEANPARSCEAHLTGAGWSVERAADAFKIHSPYARLLTGLGVHRRRGVA